MVWDDTGATQYARATEPCLTLLNQNASRCEGEVDCFRSELAQSLHRDADALAQFDVALQNQGEAGLSAETKASVTHRSRNTNINRTRQRDLIALAQNAGTDRKPQRSILGDAVI